MLSSARIDAVRAPDIGHRGDHPADASPYSVGVGDLRADVAVQARPVPERVVQNAFRGRAWRPREGEAELLVVDAGRHRGVAVDVDARV
jgi:hypothetical protein